MQLGDWQEVSIGIWWVLNFVYLLSSFVRVFSDKQKIYNIDKILLVIFFPVSLLVLVSACIMGLCYGIYNIFKINGGWLSKEWK